MTSTSILLVQSISRAVLFVRMIDFLETRVPVRQLSLHPRCFTDENLPKHDLARTIFNYALRRSRLKNFQLRIIENSTNEVVFRLVFLGKISPIRCQYTQKGTVKDVVIKIFISEWLSSFHAAMIQIALRFRCIVSISLSLSLSWSRCIRIHSPRRTCFETHDRTTASA